MDMATRLQVSEEETGECDKCGCPDCHPQKAGKYSRGRGSYLHLEIKVEDFPVLPLAKSIRKLLWHFPVCLLLCDFQNCCYTSSF